MPLQPGCPRRPLGSLAPPRRRCGRASGHAQPRRSSLRPGRTEGALGRSPGGLREEQCPERCSAARAARPRREGSSESRCRSRRVWLSQVPPGRWPQWPCLRVRQPRRCEGTLTASHRRGHGHQSVSLSASALGAAAPRWYGPWLLLMGRADSMMVTEIKFGDRCNPLDREAKTTAPSRKRVLGNETPNRHLGTKGKTHLCSLQPLLDQVVKQLGRGESAWVNAPCFRLVELMQKPGSQSRVFVT